MAAEEWYSGCAVHVAPPMSAPLPEFQRVVSSRMYTVPARTMQHQTLWVRVRHWVKG